MLYYFLELAYSFFCVVVSIVTLILIASAYRLARAYQNQGLLRWLLPALVAHWISALYWGIVCVLRVIATRTAETVILGLVLGSITGLIDIYGGVRLLSWVRTYLHDQNSAPWNQSTPTQGVWPPPPDTPGG